MFYRLVLLALAGSLAFASTGFAAPKDSLTQNRCSYCEIQKGKYQ